MTSTTNVTETPILLSSSPTSLVSSTSLSTLSPASSSLQHHRKLLTSTTEMLSLLSCNTKCSCSATTTSSSSSSSWFSIPTITVATLNTTTTNFIITTTTATTTTTSSTTANKINSSSYSLPDGTKILENQVAGHSFQDGTNSIGLLKDEKTKTVLKPAGKPICAAREIGFYKLLEITNNPDLINIKRLVPKFIGTEKIQINDKEVDFIRLEDLTYGMSQPCIMDIKIGKRTWDPEATTDKIKAEEEKYSACKKSFGLCIPGFQLYSLKDNSKLIRFSKDYGKKLNQKTFIDTLKLFLNYNCDDAGDNNGDNDDDKNADVKSDNCENLNNDTTNDTTNSKNGRFCKKLITEILLKLLDIEQWSRTQKTINLYSSSILIVYDAKRLKYCINNSVINNRLLLSDDIHTNKEYLINNYYNNCNCFNLKQNTTNKLLNGSTISNSLLLFNNKQETNDPSEINCLSSSQNHQFHHHNGHYCQTQINNKLSSSNNCNSLNDKCNIISENLDQLNGITSNHYCCNNHYCDNHNDFDIKNHSISTSSSSSTTSLDSNSSFVRVKMIDFAHVFPSIDNTIDTNYLFGIENLVKIFKGFLNEITIQEQQSFKNLLHEQQKNDLNH